MQMELTEETSPSQRSALPTVCTSAGSLLASPWLLPILITLGAGTGACSFTFTFSD